MTAFRATPSRADRVPKALYNLASSETMCFPAFTCGSLNKLGFQCLISKYDSSSDSLNDRNCDFPRKYWIGCWSKRGEI